ncbi:hypothetical protein TIFTF001_018629 [Ficus carica]|uniref:Retrotransposon gag domain-containing protein n=1 Tax=Ficus carica TaxID=3494 RepID=A0AA88D849_FICCA|nr:hypothetical protein TIFTF001_018629 [Ficus carica]
MTVVDTPPVSLSLRAVSLLQATRRVAAFPATTSLPPTFLACSTVTKPWTSEPDKTSRALTTLPEPAHRALGDLNADEVCGHNGSPRSHSRNSERPYPIKQGKRKQKSPYQLNDPSLLRDYSVESFYAPSTPEKIRLGMANEGHNERPREHNLRVGAVDPLFTSAIMATPYSSRFKMPSLASYDGFMDADEHLENYQAHMLIQKANEATLCKTFYLTLTDAARQWYRRLMPGTMDSFKLGPNARESSRPVGKKLNKDGANQVRSEKGKAVNKTEANPGPKTPAGRFHQYTPLSPPPSIAIFTRKSAKRDHTLPQDHVTGSTRVFPSTLSTPSLEEQPWVTLLVAKEVMSVRQGR